jgi:hypothetical protein
VSVQPAAHVKVNVVVEPSPASLALRTSGVSRSSGWSSGVGAGTSLGSTGAASTCSVRWPVRTNVICPWMWSVHVFVDRPRSGTSRTARPG